MGAQLVRIEHSLSAADQSLYGRSLGALEAKVTGAFEALAHFNARYALYLLRSARHDVERTRTLLFTARGILPLSINACRGSDAAASRASLTLELMPSLVIGALLLAAIVQVRLLVLRAPWRDASFFRSTD